MLDRVAKQVADRYLTKMAKDSGDTVSAAAMRVASLWLGDGKSVKTAGEVRFIKDKGSNHAEWAWGDQGGQAREIDSDYKFDAKKLKPLAKVLRAVSIGMGHTLLAQRIFVKIKSADVSPDGNLGGKGYIQKISEMRRQLQNCSEVLSSIQDTLYDEIKAPHWAPGPEVGNRERDDVEGILNEVEEVKKDPEGMAQKEEESIGQPNKI